MKTIEIRVTPNARKDEILEKDGRITVKITAPPDRGKANRAVLKLISAHYGKTARLLSGEKSRVKVIALEEQ